MTCCSLIYQFNFPTLLILTDQPDIVCSLFSDKDRAWIGTLAVFAMVKTGIEFLVHCKAVPNILTQLISACLYVLQSGSVLLCKILIWL